MLIVLVISVLCFIYFFCFEFVFVCEYGLLIIVYLVLWLDTGVGSSLICAIGGYFGCVALCLVVSVCSFRCFALLWHCCT